MAFNSFLRRASATILPLEIGSAGGVLSAVVNVGKRELVGGQFLPFSRFSTTAGDNILDLIESDYSAQLSSNNMRPTVYIPDGFPFEIEDINSRLSLRRMYQNERIRIYVDASSSEDVDDHPYFEMTAYVSRGTQDMEFKMHVEPDDIWVGEASISTIDGAHLEGFEKDLETRGIEPSMTKYLFNYIREQYEK